MTGIAKATLGLYKGCMEIDPSLKVIALHKDPINSKLPNISDAQRYSFLPDQIWRSAFLPLYVRKTKPTFIHFPWNGNIPKFLKDTIVVTTIHDVLPLQIPQYFNNNWEENKYRKRIQDSIYRSDIVITDSEYSKMKIIDNFNMDKEPVVVYPVPIIKKQAYAESESLGEYFIYVGGYDQRKGIDKLVKTFIDLHHKNRLRSKLLLTGYKNYYSRELFNCIEKGRREGIIVEVGYVPEVRLYELISNAIALVYPSKYEGFGLPPLEAMTLSCPVITTKCTSIPEICGDAVYYTDPDNDQNFSESLITLENDKELSKRLQAKGVIQASKYSCVRSARIFLRELEKSIRGV